VHPSPIASGTGFFITDANDTTSNRTANITLLGQTIPVTQASSLPPIIVNAMMLSPGVFQFAISNINQSASISVLTTTNLSLPLTNWTVLRTATNTPPGLFQFTDTEATNAQRFYIIHSP